MAGRERLTSLIGVVFLHLLLGWALLLSLAPRLVREAETPMTVFDVAPVPPPPPVEPPPPPPPASVRPAPRPSPPAASGTRAPRPEAVAPAPPRPLPAPVAAGMVPAGGGTRSTIGSGTTPASAPTQGSGSGAAGSGVGAGRGGAGAGGGGGAVQRARISGGRIVPSDYPRAAAGAQGLVQAQLAVSATGAVTGCTILRSSGNAVLDTTTCRLIRERFRFAPARDAAGRAVPDVQGWQQRWWRD